MSAEEKAVQKERRNAVRNAWKNERTLVMMGQGTRDWTAEEQKELIETGKIQGYQGHHMFSVANDNSLAGEPSNIQFLTKEEHLNAHGGDWHNQTTGRFNPETGETVQLKELSEFNITATRLSDNIMPYAEYDTLNAISSTQNDSISNTNSSQRLGEQNQEGNFGSDNDVGIETENLGSDDNNLVGIQ